MNFDSVPRLSYRIDILFTYFLFSARGTFCLPFDDEMGVTMKDHIRQLLRCAETWSRTEWIHCLFIVIKNWPSANSWTRLQYLTEKTANRGSEFFHNNHHLFVSSESFYRSKTWKQSTLNINRTITRGGRFSFVQCTNKIKWKVNGSTSSVATRIWPSLTNVWSHKGKIIRSIPIMSGVIILTCIVVRLNERVKHV